MPPTLRLLWIKLIFRENEVQNSYRTRVVPHLGINIFNIFSRPDLLVLGLLAAQHHLRCVLGLHFQTSFMILHDLHHRNSPFNQSQSHALMLERYCETGINHSLLPVRKSGRVWQSNYKWNETGSTFWWDFKTVYFKIGNEKKCLWPWIPAPSGASVCSHGNKNDTFLNT